MSAPLFHATVVTAIEDEVGWVVSLADHEHNARQYLQFQRGHVSDSQDQALGLDTYYVEKDVQSNSCYGGIKTVDLSTDAIKLRFDDAGSQSLKLEKNILIKFDVDEQTLARFRKGLTTVFAGTGLVRDGTSE